MSGTWGDTVNNGITSLIETSLAGYTSIAMTDANYTLSQANGAADEARSMMVNMTGTLTANRNVVCPNVNKMYVFRNSTTGGFSLVLKTSGGTGVTVPAGKTTTVFCDGADNIFDATSYFSGAITVNGAFTSGSATTTGVFSAPLGSVGAPSYTFTGDTNTGTWSPGADTLAWSTGGVERMRIDSSGNAGIGTTPTAPLDILTNAGAAGIVLRGRASDSVSNFSFANNGAGTTYGQLQGRSTDFRVAAVNIPMTFYNGASGATEMMRIDAAGNVLIGESSAGYSTAGRGLLEVNGATAALYALRVGSVNKGYVYHTGTDMFLSNDANGALAFNTNAIERMRIDAAGNVGIGVSPSFKLHVKSANEILRLETTTARGSGGNYFQFADPTGTTAFIGYGSSNNDLGITNYLATGALTFGTNNIERMRIDSSGNVGIGTTSPTSFGKFAVVGGAFDFFVNPGSGGVQTDIGCVGNVPLSIKTNSTERMRITAAGVIQDGAGLELGYKDIPRTTGGLTRGQAYATAAGFTVNTGSAAGSAYSVYNDSAAAFTITQGSGLTLRQGGTTNTGNRTLAARGFATIWFNSTTEAVISGSGLT